MSFEKNPNFCFDFYSFTGVRVLEDGLIIVIDPFYCCSKLALLAIIFFPSTKKLFNLVKHYSHICKAAYSSLVFVHPNGFRRKEISREQKKGKNDKKIIPISLRLELDIDERWQH